MPGMPARSVIVVDGYIPVEASELDDLREQVWAFAMDQRAFGPRQLLVAFADVAGQFLGLAYTHRTDPTDVAFEACLAYMGTGAAAAVAFCDEPLRAGPPPPEFTERFERARSLASAYGVHLVDWIACDDDLFRATRRNGMEPDEGWWDVP
jgi:hypothetical protein